MFHQVNKSTTLLFFIITSYLFSTAASAQEDDYSWPRVITTEQYNISVYAPQNIEYVNLRLKSNSAVSVKKGEEGKPVFGMMWTTSILDSDRESKITSLASITVDEVRFPDDVSEEQKENFKKLIEQEIPKWDFEIPLQQLMDSMKVVSSYQAKLDNNPPKILFATEPSVLVLIDGEPKFKAADDSYEVIINSSYFIVRETKKDKYYLRGGAHWYEAASTLGPWKSVTSVPKSLNKLLEKSKLEEEADNDSKNEAPPAIVIATESSELVVTEGEAKFTPIENTYLLYIDNTESDLFMNIDNQQYYMLISGRWFHATDLTGKWNFIDSEELPEDFKKISPESPKASVLANVAGTEEAKNALYDAQIPQTAAVNRDTEATAVTYNGQPKFEKIKGLNLEYALNTESAVFKDGNRYFLCDNAIWFQSSTPSGPWKVSEERPEEVSDIPADNPQYNTKYVYIYETSPTVVYVGYTPGYYGSYVYGNTVVYGTGYYYNPWYNGYYYHHHYSYGFAVRYNPYTGWSFGFSYGSPYGWYGHSYWGPHYHWGPRYYRPPYYRPGYRPVPSRPIYTSNRRGVTRYQRPTTRPSNPRARPSTRPNAPSTRPNAPTTRPATRPNSPSTRPNVPTTRPSSPSTRPTTRPSYNGGGNYGGSRPTTTPSRPVSRPTARPASRPMARPAGRRR